MKQQRLSWSLIIVFVLCLSVRLQAGWSEQNYPNAHLLASVEWLQAHLNDPAVRIVDLRQSAMYEAGHIPGAVHLSLHRIQATVNGVPGMAAPPEQLASVFGGLGIDNETTVVAYDNVGGLYASRLFWTLEYAGHRKIRVLNQGYQGWIASGGTVSTTASLYPAKSFEVRLDASRVISAEEIRSRLGNKDVALLDARSAGEYTGQVKWARHGGHIPGAVNVEWSQSLNMQTGGWLPPQELARMYEAQGITRDKEVVPYCQTHMRGSHSYFTLRLMGYDKVRGYDGSWVEWGNRPELPAEP